jgi:hypothetical protein
MNNVGVFLIFDQATVRLLFIAKRLTTPILWRLHFATCSTSYLSSLVTHDIPSHGLKPHGCYDSSLVTHHS